MADYDDIPQVIVEQHTANISSFLRGLLVGAGLAMFFAPRPGRETRQRVREELERLRDRLEGRLQEAQGVAEERFDELRRDVGSRVETARRDLGERRADIEYRVRESRAAIQAGIDAARRGRSGGEPGAAAPDVAAESAGEAEESA